MAKKNVSLFVSAVGWIAGLVEKLINVLREKGVTDEEIHSLVTKNGDTLIGVIAEAIIDFLKRIKRPIYSICVDYTMSVEEMVKLGNYDWANGDITMENFPTKRIGKADLEVELLHFNRIISSGDALREIDKLGYRAAELHELLTLGAKYPDVQFEFLIIALGSRWWGFDGCFNVVGLRKRGLERLLDICNFGGAWPETFRFAAVRK